MCHVSLSTVRQFPCPRDLLSTPHPGQPEEKKPEEQQVCYPHHSKWMELPPKALPPELRHGHFTMSTATHHLPQQRVLIHYNKNSTFSPVCSYPRQVLKGLWKPEQSTKGKQISKHWPETITESFSCTPGMQRWGPSLPITTISLTNGNSSFRSLLKDHFIKGTIS